MNEESTPVLFVHGQWLHATSWGPWVDRFRAEGYDPSAPGWPGEPDTVEESRRQADSVAGYGLDAVAEHYAAIIGRLPKKPVLIGHSMGGLLVQRLLADGLGAAAVSIDAAPPKGVIWLPLSSLRVAWAGLRNPSNRKKHAVALTREQFRYGFGNALSEEESDSLFDKWAIPSSGRPLFEVATANLVPGSPAAIQTKNSDRGPLLLIGGGLDNTAPASTTRANVKLYRHARAVTDHQEFPDRGHSLALDSRWSDVADAAVSWLRSQKL